MNWSHWVLIAFAMFLAWGVESTVAKSNADRERMQRAEICMHNNLPLARCYPP